MLKDVLERFAIGLIKDAKLNLSDWKKNNTGKLSQSLGYTLTDNSVEVFGEDYLIPVDIGRFPQNVNKVYYPNIKDFKAYATQKSVPTGIPVDKLKQWLRQRGLKESLSYIINKKIREKGIEPSYFFTKAFNKSYLEITEDIEVDLVNEIEAQLYGTLTLE